MLVRIVWAYLALAGLSANASCWHPLSKPAMVVFLMDTSMTVQRFEAFRRGWDATIEQLQDDDVAIFATVKGDAHGGEGGQFPYLVKQVMPCYSVLGTRERYERDRAAAKAKLRAAFDEALARPHPQRTLFLGSLRRACVISAGSPSEGKGLETERFWLAYFKSVGADLPPHRYAGELVGCQR